LTKQYSDVVAVESVTLDVRPGEFLTFLGPSGSGKTTTLRMIAGFTRPDAGTVVLDNRDLTRVPPYTRDIGMVFQNYALFPHMTAAENISFPLEMRRIKRLDARRLVHDVLELVQLSGVGSRYPDQLSGGQQQRVALARAIVFGPKVLLMDEPLGSLDKKLREALQLEIVRISRQLGRTVVYVTHDQEEALVMSDRIAIYNRGRIDQVGIGEELYTKPSSLFVADFIGESNIFPGRLERSNDGGSVVGEGFRIRVSQKACKLVHTGNGARVAVVVRPEQISIRPAETTGAVSNDHLSQLLPGMVREVIYLGPTSKYLIELENGSTLRARVQAEQSEAKLMPGTSVRVVWRIEDAILVADETEPVASASSPN
jgi:putative spermidine/putrescine transport system ATP-binding protein